MALDRVPPAHTTKEAGEAPRPSFSWRRELLQWVALIAAIVGAQLLVGWYNGRGPRLYFVAGFACWLTAFTVMGARRRWLKSCNADIAASRWRFSAAELLLIFTGAIAYIGFTAADYRDSLRLQPGA